ncbi:hypothetical protein [Undibacterium flavidum]|uniref:Uncharacterized protein n=1 Tax=Undibacterium flavidum TaxID=2762297 RepID=A0ABR6YE55_9BURK|nr:hypothetical protein [Undibacterium flavidum]MBC3874838.1 hypothetical protein [Undibacterium flavidum]
MSPNRFSNIKSRRRLFLSVTVLFLLALTACSTAAVNTRMQYWRDEVKLQLPIGTSKRHAEEFFATRGVKLICCVSMSHDKKFHYINERKVASSLLMDYDVVVLLEISPEETVTSVSVQSWGIGL